MQNVLLLTQTTARLLAGSQPDDVSPDEASPFFLRFRCLPPVGIESYLRRLGLDGVYDRHVRTWVLDVHGGWVLLQRLRLRSVRRCMYILQWFWYD